jgi:hypothetical protein
MVPGLIERDLRAAEQRRCELLAYALARQPLPTPAAGRSEPGDRIPARGAFAPFTQIGLRIVGRWRAAAHRLRHAPAATSAPGV